MTLAVIAAPCRAVTREDVLDHLLALLARRQVDVDVRPFAALFGEEALEEQLHADGVDGGDAERVADGAVGSRAAPLRQHATLAGVARDVPHDQEVAGEVELLDHAQFVLELALRALGKRMAVARARAVEGEAPQQRRLRLAVFGGEGGEAVAEVAHAEGAALGDLARRSEPRGAIGEAARPLRRCEQMALGVGREATSRGVEGDVVAQAGEGVEERAIRLARVAHVVGRDDRDAERLRDGRRPARFAFGAPVEMARDVDPHPPGSEHAPGPLERRGGERAVSAHQRDEIAGVLGDFVPGRRCVVLAAALVGHGEQPREVSIAALRLDQQQQLGPVLPPRSWLLTIAASPAAFAAWWKRGIP